MKDKYNFKVGEKVIDVLGRKGKIVKVCHCECCEQRGFYEIAVEWDNDKGQCDYYTNVDEQSGFKDLHSIGDRIFNQFDLDKAIFKKKELEKIIKFYKERRREIIKGIKRINKASGNSKI